MKTISCFSYKGGAGRSTLALNVVPFLAEKLNATPDQPLILVDLDVDSCGLTFLFDLANKPRIATMNVQHLFGKGGSIPQAEEDEDIHDHSVLSGLFPVGEFFGFEDKAIVCLPARPQARLSETENGNYDYSDKNFADFVRVCRDYDCAGILFDAPVGGQCTANWAKSTEKECWALAAWTRRFCALTRRPLTRSLRALCAFPRLAALSPAPTTDSCPAPSLSWCNTTQKRSKRYAYE